MLRVGTWYFDTCIQKRYVTKVMSYHWTSLVNKYLQLMLDFHAMPWNWINWKNLFFLWLALLSKLWISEKKWNEQGQNFMRKFRSLFRRLSRDIPGTYLETFQSLPKNVICSASKKLFWFFLLEFHTSKTNYFVACVTPVTLYFTLSKSYILRYCFYSCLLTCFIPILPVFQCFLVICSKWFIILETSCILASNSKK